MNKLFLWIAAAAVLLQSCEKTDGLWDEINSLQDRVAALETHVGAINADIVSLHRLLDTETRIVGVTQTGEGYRLELSDGESLEITVGEKIPALVPSIDIDGEGFWTYSLDGETWTRLTVDGKPVPAWPAAGNDHTENAAGVTPQLSIDADGYWLVDAGEGYRPLLFGGEKVNALGGNVTVSCSIFDSVDYDAQNSTLIVGYGEHKSIVLKVFDTFSLKISAAEEETFALGETRAFEVEQNGVEQAVIKGLPDGWTAELGETELRVTAPARYSAENAGATLSITIYSAENYRRNVFLRLKLLNERLDADACSAWRSFAAGREDNVLLDFSYAGYKRGEEAPADGFALGYKVYNVVDYGADPTGASSSRSAFKSLLAELKLDKSGSASPNAVIYFPEGRFILHDQTDDTDGKSSDIQIFGSNFVIKGAGRDKTVLVMDSPNLPDNPANMWSSPTMINIKHNSTYSREVGIAVDAPKGSFSVEVDGISANIAPGKWVCLSMISDDPNAVADELGPYHKVDNPQMTGIQKVTVEEYHLVKAVSGSTVTFFEPVMHEIKTAYEWKLGQYKHYENVGIEDLSFEGHSKEKFGHHSSWQDDGAYKPLQIMRVTDSWVRRVDFHDVSEALSIVSSANCSAYDIVIDGNRGHSSVRSQGSSRVFIGKVVDRSHGYALTNSSGDAFGQWMDNAGQYHATGVSKTSVGAVLWRNTWGDDAMFESHASQPRATLVDACTGGFVRWRFGGDEKEVPNHLDDLTIWNMNATRVNHDFSDGVWKWWDVNNRWWKVMPPVVVGFHGQSLAFDETPEQTKYIESNGTAVQPESLYEAQLRARLGYVPAWLNSLK